MREKPTTHDRHLDAALRRAEHLKNKQMEVRRVRDEELAEDRHRRRLLPLMASVREVESDFPGCMW